MDNSYEYAEEEEEGLTFKKIGHFLAKGWVRMLVYAAICVVLTAMVVLPIKAYYKSETAARATIEYTYSGIEDNKAPDGGVYNSNSVITPDIVSKAVVTAKLGDKITDLNSLNDKLRVDGVRSAEYYTVKEAADKGDEAAQAKLEAMKNPTRYEITLSSPGDLGLSDAEANQLVDAIIQEYLVDFKKNYAVSQMFDNGFNLSDSDSLEFTDIVDIYVSTIDGINSSINSLPEKVRNYPSTKTGKIVAQLKTELSSVSLQLNSFNSYVVANDIWKDRDVMAKVIDKSVETYTNQLESQKQTTIALQKQVDAMTVTPQITPTGSGQQVVITVQYDSGYYVIQNKLTASIEAERELKNALDNAKARQASLSSSSSSSSSSSVIEATKQRLQGIEKSASDTVSLLNDTISDYYDVQYVANKVKIASSSAVTRKSISMNVLIVLLVAGLVGLVAGGIVTGVKISKANAKAKAAAAGTDTPSEEKDK